ncbi:UPF0149 family protein [Pseudoalteromonas fenneropenaei]|uniref:UPF0149 family protein n=1 Tax=Pseudoalteromonas fenneropenaei TaxID=1737459 RepID=A0ABV7CQ67_9GAMM
MYQFEFTDSARQLLAQLMKSDPQQRSLAFIEGWLFADICAPQAREAQEWLDALQLAPSPLDEEQVFAFMAFHHHISEQVFAESGYQLPWQDVASWPQLHDWSLGFLAGVARYLDTLLTAQGQSLELQQALQQSTEQLGFFALQSAQITAYCEQQGIAETAFLQQQIDLAAEFAPHYVMLIEAAAQVLFD